MAKDSSVVVTLDIGDTYSGYAYMYLDEFSKDGWTINPNDGWPRDKHVTNKTASTLLLQPHGGEEGAKYGYDAEKDFNEKFLDGEHKEYLLFKNIKSAFYKDDITLETTIVDVNSGQEKRLCDVMLTMINYFKKKAVIRIQNRFDSMLESDIFWVMAIPAAWNQRTTMFYRDLVIESGISHRKLEIVTEPEACLAYAMQFLEKKVSKKQRDKISQTISLFDARVLVLDLSGDATTISVHRVSGDKTFKMVFQSRSHKKGSSQVNDQFFLFLSNVLGEDIIRTLRTDYIDDYHALYSEFEMRKREINSNTSQHDWFTFRFPHQIEDTFQEKLGKEYRTIHQRISAKSNYVNRVKYEKDKLSVDFSVLVELFKPVIDRVETYIKNVLLMQQCARVVSFILVGGFSQSVLVQKGIRKRFPEMAILIPADPELAIMKGAIIRAVIHDTKPPTPSSGDYHRNVEQSTICEIL